MSMIHDWNYEVIRDFCGTVYGHKQESIDNTPYSKIIDKETHIRNLELIIRFPEFFQKYFPDKDERDDRAWNFLNGRGNHSDAVRMHIRRILVEHEYDLLYNARVVMLLTDLMYDEFPGLKEIAVNEIKISEKEIHNPVDEVVVRAGFDIYQYAKEYDADYYDMHTGYIYQVQNYNHCLKLGLPTPGIRVVDSVTNEVIGYAEKL